MSFSAKVIIAILLVVTAGVIVFQTVFNKYPQTKYEFSQVVRGNVISDVTATGSITPIQSVDLNFEISGKVSLVNAEAGDRVSEGQVLVALDSTDLQSQRDQAEANVNSEQAKLDELKIGARPETISIDKAKVLQAQVSVTDSEKNLIDSALSAYNKADNAVHNLADEIFSNPQSSNPLLAVTIADQILVSNLTKDRISIEVELNSWHNAISVISPQEDLQEKSELSHSYLIKISSYLREDSLGVNSLTSSSNLSQSTINGYKSDISTARANVDSAIFDLTAKTNSLRDAEASLSVAQSNLTYDQAGSRPEDIAAQQASVDQAKASLEQASVAIRKTELRAPFQGVVSDQNAKVGQVVMAGEGQIVSLISSGRMEIDSNIAEADIAKVWVGQEATVTLDSLGNDAVFSAKVVSIDPGQVIIDGVPTYKTKFVFTAADNRIRPGMTANLTIHVDKKNNVIKIPQRALIEHNGKYTVLVGNPDGSITSVPVTTGIMGSNGDIEITSGLSEGEKIVISQASP